MVNDSLSDLKTPVFTGIWSDVYYKFQAVHLLTTKVQKCRKTTWLQQRKCQHPITTQQKYSRGQHQGSFTIFDKSLNQTQSSLGNDMLLTYSRDIVCFNTANPMWW